MSFSTLSVLFVSAVLLISCAKPAANHSPGRHASIIMRDGTIYSGIVTSTSGDQLKLAGDDRNNYTLATANIKSIDYGDDQSAAAQATPPPAAPLPAAPAQATPPRAMPPPPQNAPPPPPYHPAEAEIRTRTWIVPAGTEIGARTDETIDSKRAAEGQTYAARITRDVRDRAGFVVIPRGSNALLVIRSVSRGGDLLLGLVSVSIEGRRYRLITTEIDERGRKGVGANQRTPEYAGGGGVLGALVGALAGGGRGAALGALTGAGAGAATEVLTKGRAIRVPAETVLVFRLERPLRVVAR